MQEGQHGDQRQVLGMVAPHTRLVRAKGQLLGPRQDDGQRLQQSLGILVTLAHGLHIGLDAVQRIGRPLPLVDGGGLRGLFVHREHQAAIGEFGVRVP